MIQDRDTAFSLILTRDFTPCKPDPAPILHICQQWQLKPSEVVMIGDARDDVQCGRSAGCPTILLASDHNVEVQTHPAVDIVIQNIDEVAQLLLQAQPWRQAEFNN